MAVVNCLGKGTPYNGESDNNKETYWKKEWQKEAKERLDLHTKIMEEYDIQLAAIEAKYKKSKHKSFSTALRLNKVAKKRYGNLQIKCKVYEDSDTFCI